MRREEIKQAVKDRYGRVAAAAAGSCCGGGGSAEALSRKVGYSQRELDAVPQGATLGLGCGNPVALASLREDEVVIDLGSGGGLDCFLAAARVGKAGRVIGVDMTPEMIDKARANARRGGYDNVEFRLGEIEDLPVADGSADAVISNCVVNLVPDKPRAFREAFRVLKPGGRLMISDIVLLRDLPPSVKSSLDAYVGCVAGAMTRSDYLAAIEGAGFHEIEVVGEAPFGADCLLNDPAAAAVVERLSLTRDETERLARSVVSIKVSAVKPSGGLGS